MRLFLLLLAVVFMSVIRPDNAVAAVYGRADMSYQKTTSTTAGQTAESSSLSQGYSLGFNHALTSAITIAGDVRWSMYDTGTKQTEDVYPVFYLTYTPPSMYYLSFSYNRNEYIPPGGDRIAISNMNASFALPLEKWPSLALSYNLSTTSDYLYPHKIDTETENKNLNTNYNIIFLETSANLNYSYSDPVTKDNVAKTKSETPSHQVSANLSRPFWDQRIQTGVNIGYNQAENINESLGAPVQFEQKITASDGLYLITATPAIGALASTPALIDNNTGASAGIDLNGINRNIGLRFATAESVHKINLYISTSDPNIATYVNNSPTYFGWQLYISSDGTNWTLFGTPTASYDAAYSRIVFTFTETSALYFKVVNTLFPAGALTINVTEIEAIGFFNSTPTVKLTSVTKRDFGGLNISFAPITRLSMNYNINYDHSTRDVSRFETTGVNQGGGLSLIVVPEYLNLTTNYTTSTTKSSRETTTGQTSALEAGTNSYALSLSTTPLPTLNASLNYGYNESLTDGDVSSTSNSTSGNIFMRLYKGVNLGLTSTLSASKDLKANSTTDAASHSANLNLVPWRPLTIVVNGGISDSATQQAGAETHSSGKTLNANLSYTPTRSLYLAASFTIEPTSSQSYSATWLPTRNTQVSARYGSAGNATNMGGDFSWTPIYRLVLHIGYTGTQTDNMTHDHSEAIFASASLNL